MRLQQNLRQLPTVAIWHISEAMNTTESDADENVKTRKYEILNSLPAYGPMYIPVTERNEPFYSEGFPVRFYKSDGSSWVANFQPGWTGFNEIHELTDTEKLLVVAGGTCYVMHPDNTKPISVFGVGFVNIFKTQDERFVLEGSVDLTIVEANGDYWHCERISWDGLKDLKLNGNLITGFSYDPMNDIDQLVEFTYNIDTKILMGGSYKQYEIRRTNKKPWWKIW
ncbi:hypothetical protein [Hymenobacter sp. PAMC 26628]|uniref:hypothetical protein n=1 Tax=Hymenobacter sp. PAMC 26628 TaxID=1484118 RepID=UPI000B0B6246|nr:hypothetical protein [Hymenobacter sp. PAMC 26628]